MLPILALDPGLIMGWAFGEAGAHCPRSGSEKVTLVSLVKWLDDAFRRSTPRLVMVERVLPLKAYQRLGTGEASVYMTLKQHGVIEAMCGRWGVECRDIDVLDVRQHFTGKRSHGGRREGKLATVRRCHQLGYMPRGEHDEDRADALAIWDWASVTIGKQPPRVLQMFGGSD